MGAVGAVGTVGLLGIFNVCLYATNDQPLRSAEPADLRQVHIVLDCIVDGMYLD